MKTEYALHLFNRNRIGNLINRLIVYLGDAKHEETLEEYIKYYVQ